MLARPGTPTVAMQRRNSLPSLRQLSPQGSPSAANMSRRSSTPSLRAAAAQSFDSAVEPKKQGAQESKKLRKSSTLSSLAGSVLAGSPGNALRRAVKRLGNKGRKTDKVIERIDEEGEAEVDVNILKQQAKADKKRLQELYNRPSQLRIHQVHSQHDAPALVNPSSHCLGDTDVGMVRLAYKKIRSLREEKDYENTYKRNSWKDLVGDLRHGIRVCMKAQAFINILVEATDKKQECCVDQDWCVNPSIEKQRMWTELLSFVEKPSLKSQANNSSAEFDQELAKYRAMIMSSKPLTQPSGEDEVSLPGPPGVTDVLKLQPCPPSSPPPAKCSPMLAKLMNRSGQAKA